jgi:hypothetical protein
LNQHPQCIIIPIACGKLTAVKRQGWKPYDTTTGPPIGTTVITGEITGYGMSVACCYAWHTPPSSLPPMSSLAGNLASNHSWNLMLLTQAVLND